MNGLGVKNMARNSQKRDIRAEITESIVESLKKGVKPWSASFSGQGRPLRSNGVPYRGINVMILWGKSLALGYRNQNWFTYNQAKALGAQVRKGEKSAAVVFYKPLKVKDRTDTTKEKTIPLMRMYNVFNAEQIDNLPQKFVNVEKTSSITSIETVDEFVKNAGAIVRHSASDLPHYKIGADVIVMPDKQNFIDTDSYYATLMHECVHWTGKESRCNRDGITKFDHFGSEQYATEELIAELGAAYLCADLNITDTIREDHAQYIGAWLKVLKNDHSLIFKCATQAEKAIDLLKATSPSLIATNENENENENN